MKKKTKEKRREEQNGTGYVEKRDVVRNCRKTQSSAYECVEKNERMSRHRQKRAPRIHIPTGSDIERIPSRYHRPKSPAIKIYLITCSRIRVCPSKLLPCCLYLTLYGSIIEIFNRIYGASQSRLYKREKYIEMIDMTNNLNVCKYERSFVSSYTY